MAWTSSGRVSHAMNPDVLVTAQSLSSVVGDCNACNINVLSYKFNNDIYNAILHAVICSLVRQPYPPRLAITQP